MPGYSEKAKVLVKNLDKKHPASGAPGPSGPLFRPAAGFTQGVSTKVRARSPSISARWGRVVRWYRHKCRTHHQALLRCPLFSHTQAKAWCKRGAWGEGPAGPGSPQSYTAIGWAKGPAVTFMVKGPLKGPAFP